MIALDRPKTQAPAAGRMLLHGISWETYERLLAEHDESAGPRFTYDDGFLEIMTLSIEHEDPNTTLTLLVELILIEWDVDCQPAGSNTFKRSELHKGFEPDASFYIQNAAKIRGRKRLKLPADPPPDLIIEIEVTEPLLPRLPIFAAMGVPEVWVCEGESVRILHLERGCYRDVKRSAALAPLSAEAITDFLRRRLKMKRPAWARAVRAWAQAHPR